MDADLGILLINKDNTDEQRWTESDVYIIALQACFATAIAIISIPMNILMIMAMIMCHCLLDKAFIISIFFLIASWKLVVALFFSCQELVSVLLDCRSWNLTDEQRLAQSAVRQSLQATVMWEMKYMIINSGYNKQSCCKDYFIAFSE